jgi:hypothetical protein
MTLQTTFDEGPGYLVAEIRGQWDEEHSAEAIDAIRDEAIKRSLTRILVDARGLSTPRTSMTSFLTGEHIAEAFGHPFKLASLATREVYGDGFAETVALNRGANVLTFFEKGEALQWLLTGFNKTDAGDDG